MRHKLHMQSVNGGQEVMLRLAELVVESQQHQRKRLSSLCFVATSAPAGFHA